MCYLINSLLQWELIMSNTEPKIILRKNASMADFQKYIHDLETLHGWLDVSMIHTCFLMGEEVGELFKAIRKHQKYSNEGEPSNEETSKIKVGEELVDVLNYILALANRLDIDMEDAFRRKNLINQTRSWSTTNST